jgi:hypothetical protein
MHFRWLSSIPALSSFYGRYLWLACAYVLLKICIRKMYNISVSTRLRLGTIVFLRLCRVKWTPLPNRDQTPDVTMSKLAIYEFCSLPALEWTSKNFFTLLFSILVSCLCLWLFQVLQDAFHSFSVLVSLGVFDACFGYWWYPRMLWVGLQRVSQDWL